MGTCVIDSLLLLPSRPYRRQRTAIEFVARLKKARSIAGICIPFGTGGARLNDGT